MSRRLFFGLKPDIEVRNAIDRSFRKLPDFLGQAHHPDDLHLTLAFLGQINGSMDGIRNLVSEIKLSAFSMVLDRFDFWSKSGVLVLRPSHVPDTLYALNRELRTRMLRCGLRQDTQTFSPHVTLAYQSQLPGMHGPKAPIPWYVDRFCLYVSSTMAEPPRYRVIDQWLLDTGP